MWTKDKRRGRKTINLRKKEGIIREQDVAALHQDSGALVNRESRWGPPVEHSFGAHAVLHLVKGLFPHQGMFGLTLDLPWEPSPSHPGLRVHPRLMLRLAPRISQEYQYRRQLVVAAVERAVFLYIRQAVYCLERFSALVLASFARGHIVGLLALAP